MRANPTSFRRLALRLFGVVAAVAAGMAVAQDGRVSYPVTRRLHHVDTLHRTNVEDPYRWLEIAAAEYLIAEKYTRPAKLATHGSSNGGLLVGACMVQRPELYGACLSDAGTIDMLRFHKFSIGPYLVSEFGSPENPEEFKGLPALSPYHNLKKGVKYPATLVTTQIEEATDRCAFLVKNLGMIVARQR